MWTRTFQIYLRDFEHDFFMAVEIFFRITSVSSLFSTSFIVSVYICVPLIALPFSKKYHPNMRGAPNISLNLLSLSLTCVSTGL